MDLQRRALLLIDSAYAAAVAPERWTDFLWELSEACGRAGAALALRLPGPREEGLVYRARMHERDDDVLLRHVLRGLPWGSLDRPRFHDRFHFTAEVFPDEKIPETDFYREWMAGQGFAPRGPLCHTIAVRDGRVFALIALYGRSGERALGDADLRLCNLLVPHLKQAYEIHAHCSGVEHERLALGEVMDRLLPGVILLDARRQPVLVSRSARRILDQSDGFWFDAGGPRVVSQSETATLRQYTADAVAVGSESGPLQPAVGGAGGLMVVSRPSGRRGYTVHVAPLLAAPPESRAGDAVAYIMISDLDDTDVSPAEVLQSLYSLTPAESELVRLLVQGRSLEQAAAARGVSLNTVRTQLKHIFSKTDTKRQGELVQMVLAGINPLHGFWSDAPEPRD